MPEKMSAEINIPAELKKVVQEAAKLRRRRTAMTCFSDEHELV